MHIRLLIINFGVFQFKVVVFALRLRHTLANTLLLSDVLQKGVLAQCLSESVKWSDNNEWPKEAKNKPWIIIIVSNKSNLLGLANSIGTKTEPESICIISWEHFNTLFSTTISNYVVRVILIHEIYIFDFSFVWTYRSSFSPAVSQSNKSTIFFNRVPTLVTRVRIQLTAKGYLDEPKPFERRMVSKLICSHLNMWVQRRIRLHTILNINWILCKLFKRKY